MTIGTDHPFSPSSSSSIAVSSVASIASFVGSLSLFMIYVSSSSMVSADEDKPCSGSCSHCGSTTISLLTS